MATPEVKLSATEVKALDWARENPWPLSLRQVPEIGEVTENKLKAAGIHNPRLLLAEYLRRDCVEGDFHDYLTESIGLAGASATKVCKVCKSWWHTHEANPAQAGPSA